MRIYDNLPAVSQYGYTLIELIITITIISVLAAIAVPAYQHYIIRSQTSESLALAHGLKTLIAINLQEGTCFSHDATNVSETEGIDKITGKYGTATIISSTNGLPPCGIQYTFNSTGVSGQVKGKTIVMTVSKDSVLAKDSDTTVDDKYLPQAIK